ncbi:hypothetical protein BDM02DRAFT_3260883 [Thelephora ganbajun]|uniref:Uncharacterized protein n=1 Tax=Thelephora ganbajun TaxID=370292 RepID=A0ACB6ZGJ6_THEGA|nr:hypothetical protein BDM02DRAFT_3260883 [Thelephora ganbajun]
MTQIALPFLPPDGSTPGFSSLVSPLYWGSLIRCVLWRLPQSLLSFSPSSPPSRFTSMSTSTPLIAVEVPPEYQTPSYFYLLKNSDSIYASGLFCHIAKVGRKRDQQLRLIWAVEQMVRKLREVREENLQLRSPFFHAKRSAKRKISSQFKTSEDEIPLGDRLARETKLYKEARERLKRGKPLRFVPDYDNITRAHRQLSASLRFFYAGMYWMGMPRWRKPYLDFEWAPPPPTPLPPAKSVDGAVSGLDVRSEVEIVKTPELMRADSERPSIADSEATLVSGTLTEKGDDEQIKGSLESSRSARSFSLIQSFCSFISDPGNPLVSF